MTAMAHRTLLFAVLLFLGYHTEARTAELSKAAIPVASPELQERP
jgi:hypothetical protein